MKQESETPSKFDWIEQSNQSILHSHDGGNRNCMTRKRNSGYAMDFNSLYLNFPKHKTDDLQCDLHIAVAISWYTVLQKKPSLLILAQKKRAINSNHLTLIYWFVHLSIWTEILNPFSLLDPKIWIWELLSFSVYKGNSYIIKFLWDGHESWKQQTFSTFLSICNFSQFK